MLHFVRRHGPLTVRRVVFTVLFFLALGFLLASTLGAQERARPAWADQLDSLMDAELARTRTPGAQVAVAFEGKVIYSKGYGVADIETSRPVTAQTLFRIGSVTKMMTGALLAELSVQGKLDLQAPISTYVTELAGKRVGAVTSHQLLTHQAGWIDNAVPYGRMGEGALGEVMTEVTDTMFLTQPGRVLSYSNPGYSMAGYVAERAAGRRYGTQMDDLILRRFGMPHATFRPLAAMTRDFSQGHLGAPENRAAIVRPFTENTAQWAAGFLLASAEEVARFGIVLMDGGMLDGERVMSAEAVRLVTQGHIAVPGDTAARYGYGILIGKFGEETMWQHGGAINGFDALVTMIPARRLAVVVIDNRGGAPLMGVGRFVTRTITGYAPPEPTPPPAERAPTAAERAQVVGNYAAGRNTMSIIEQGDTLVFQQGMARLGVRVAGDDRLILVPPSGTNKLTLLLVRDASGRVTHLHQGMRAIERVDTP